MRNKRVKWSELGEYAMLHRVTVKRLFGDLDLRSVEGVGEAYRRIWEYWGGYDKWSSRRLEVGNGEERNERDEGYDNERDEEFIEVGDQEDQEAS